MKTKFFISILLAFIAITSFAQDTICKINGSKIIAQVTEINAISIKYKIQNNGTEIPVEVSKSEIAYIVYANGVKEVFKSTDTKREFSSVVEPPEAPVEKPDPIKAMNNIIAINTFDLLFTNLTISYERFSKSGLLSLKIPVSVGFGGNKYNEKEYAAETSTQFMQNRLYSGGLELNIYPFKRTKHTFYFGIAAVAGSFVYYEHVFPEGSFFGTGNMYLASATHVKHIGAHYSGMIHVGGYLGITDNLLIGGKIAAGLKKEQTIESYGFLPKFQLDLNLAYRF